MMQPSLLYNSGTFLSPQEDAPIYSHSPFSVPPQPPATMNTHPLLGFPTWEPAHVVCCDWSLSPRVMSLRLVCVAACQCFVPVRGRVVVRGRDGPHFVQWALGVFLGGSSVNFKFRGVKWVPCSLCISVICEVTVSRSVYRLYFLLCELALYCLGPFFDTGI